MAFNRHPRSDTTVVSPASTTGPEKCRLEKIRQWFQGVNAIPFTCRNENTNGMLDLHLFKGRDSPVTYSRTNKDSMAVVPNRRKTWCFKALAIAKGRVAPTG
jgi:hypothetical protein